MSKSVAFNLDHFLSLAGSELATYVEPFLTTHIESVPQSVYDLVQFQLTSMDEEHTVYALEICMLLRPNEFVTRAVSFLSHTDAAVCCAAYNAINHLPSTLATAELVAKIAATPQVDLFAAD